jgi:hypothetical protein
MLCATSAGYRRVQESEAVTTATVIFSQHAQLRKATKKSLPRKLLPVQLKSLPRSTDNVL